MHITYDFIFFCSSEFATLLGSGDLTEKSSTNLTPTDQEFPLILAKICFHLHFRGETWWILNSFTQSCTYSYFILLFLEKFLLLKEMRFVRSINFILPYVCPLCVRLFCSGLCTMYKICLKGIFNQRRTPKSWLVWQEGRIAMF